MTKRKDFLKPLRDIEKPYETVADSFIDDGLGVELLTVRLAGLWTDLIRPPGESRDDPDAAQPSPPAVPLLDEMKGIRQWD
jgi:hypothetical protein